MPQTINEMTKQSILELFNDDDFRKQVVKNINDDIDIPMINEKTEKKVFNKIYQAFVSALQKI